MKQDASNILAVPVAGKDGRPNTREYGTQKESQMEKFQRIRQGFFGVLFVMAKDADKEQKFYLFMLMLSLYQVRCCSRLARRAWALLGFSDR
jgi:hypothetical protein